MIVNDFGPIYSETVAGRFPVEPLNTISNLVFLLILIYFTNQTKLSFKTYPFIVISLPILLTGFIGGTVFHATRSHRIWLILDFIPIFILTGFASVFFWKQYFNSFFYGLLTFITLFLLTMLVRISLELPRGYFIAIGYSTLAANILLPAFLCLKKFKNISSKYLHIGLVSFIVAIFFRQIDSSLSFGTHFLWHIFGGVATFFIMKFIYLLEKESAFK